MSARRTSTWIAALDTTLVSLASLAAGAPAGQAVFTVPSFDPGADLRLRQVFIGNVGLNDKSPTADRTFQRYRGPIRITPPAGRSGAS